MALLDKLLKQREELEQKIEEAKQNEKRKTAIVTLVEKAGLMSLSDDILKAEFQRIAQTHSPKSGLGGGET